MLAGSRFWDKPTAKGGHGSCHASPDRRPDPLDSGEEAAMSYLHKV